MPYITPKYGLEVPSPSTRFRDLGIELQQMGIAIEEVLESFDYNGADPNLVLSRVAALEAWRDNAAAELAYLSRQYRTTVQISGSGSPGYTTTVTFPAGLFADPPHVHLTKQGGRFARGILYAESVTANGCIVGIYDGSGSNMTSALPLDIALLALPAS